MAKAQLEYPCDISAEQSSTRDRLITFWHTVDGWRYIIGFRQGAIRYSSTQLTYGLRYWLHCPHCDRRQGKLYLVGDELMCRHCADLHYHTQSMDETRRLAAKIRKHRHGLWGDDWPNIDNLVMYPYDFARPPGVRWQRYWDSLFKLMNLETRYWQAEAEQISRQFGISIG